MAPPKRYRLAPSEKILPSFRVGALEANVAPSLDICPHIEESALLKGFERSMVEMVLGIETDTLSFVTWPCQHKSTIYQTKPQSRLPNRSQLSTVDIQFVVDYN